MLFHVCYKFANLQLEYNFLPLRQIKTLDIVLVPYEKRFNHKQRAMRQPVIILVLVRPKNPSCCLSGSDLKQFVSSVAQLL